MQEYTCNGFRQGGEPINFTVPQGGVLAVKAFGARGEKSYSSSCCNGGSAAVLSGEVDVAEGDLIRMVVGCPGALGNTIGGAGGGGTFVQRGEEMPGELLIAAGGGGGAHYSNGGGGSATFSINGRPGLGGVCTAKTNSVCSGAGGINGTGGLGGSGGGGGPSGGGGWLTPGGDGEYGNGGCNFGGRAGSAEATGGNGHVPGGYGGK